MKKLLIILTLFTSFAKAQTIDTLASFGIGSRGKLLYYTNYTLPNTVKYYFNGFGAFAQLNTDSIIEGSTNVFFTNVRARSAISLTTTGTSGAATYNSSTGVLNVPNYAVGGGAADSAYFWNLRNGNIGTGTDTLMYLGTNNFKKLLFKVGATTSMFIDSMNRVHVGTIANSGTQTSLFNVASATHTFAEIKAPAAFVSRLYLTSGTNSWQFDNRGTVDAPNNAFKIINGAMVGLVMLTTGETSIGGTLLINPVTNGGFLQLPSLTSNNTQPQILFNLTGSPVHSFPAGGGIKGGLYAYQNQLVYADSTTTARRIMTSIDTTMGTRAALNGSNATTGNVGELMRDTINAANALALTTATPKQVMTNALTLTPGDWDVEGVCYFVSSSATITELKVGSSTNFEAFDGENTFSVIPYVATTVSNTYSVNIPVRRYSISANTFCRLTAQATFSAGTMTAYGSIRARRVR